MKKILGFLIMITVMTAVPQIMQADSYSSLWKQYEKANNKDLPKTQLEILDKIARKAEKKQDYGQLMKAELFEIEVKSKISQDSVAPCLERLKKKETAAEISGNKALTAVYESMLGKLYNNFAGIVDDAEQQSLEYYRKSMSNPAVLASTDAKGYEPAMTEGYDSYIFYNDLLHALGFEARDYKTMHDWYEEHNNRSAACICALKQLERQYAESGSGEKVEMKHSVYLQKLDSLIKVYGDLTVTGEVAIEKYCVMDEAMDASVDDKMNYINYALNRWGAWPRMNVLRNAKNRLTLPNYLVEIGSQVLTPDREHVLQIRQFTNVGYITARVTKVNLDENTKLNPAVERDYAYIKKCMLMNTQWTWRKKYVGQLPYKVNRDSITLPGLSAGLYLAEFVTDNTSIKPERTFFRVSDMMAVYQELPENVIRFVAVSATTGNPVPGASIRIATRKSGNEWNGDEKFDYTVMTCDSKGEAEYEYGKKRPNRVYVYTENDKYCPETRINTYFNLYSDNSERKLAAVYTDRALYRPGQTVHAAVMAYRTYADKTTKVMPDANLKMMLLDANGKTVETKELKTDEYGTAASDFVLPTAGLTGVFRLCVTGDADSRTSFRVEEYKRPTFEVDMELPEGRYAEGETVKIKGMAKTYAGMPVLGARVTYTVSRSINLWRTMKGEDVATDTVTTAEDGSFFIPVKMNIPEAKNKYDARYYRFDVSALVTDGAGETREGNISVPYSNRSAILKCDLPQRGLCDSIRTVNFTYENIFGKEIPGIVTYILNGGNGCISGKAEANKNVALDLSGLSSGTYTLNAVCNGDTLNRNFTLFRLEDEKPAEETHDWFYQSSEVFHENGNPVFVQVGSSDADQTLYYTLVSGKKVIEKGSWHHVNAGVLTLQFRYKPGYGDGITIAYAWARDGIIYTHQAEIKKFVAPAVLNVKWITFRDRLIPGQKETWTLNVTDRHGKPAKAQLMATMFDESLDAIRLHRWNRPSLNGYIYMPRLDWNGTVFSKIQIYGEMPFSALREVELDFTHWQQLDIPDMMCYVNNMMETRAVGNSRVLMAKSSAPIAMAARAESSVVSTSEDANDETEARQSVNGSMRENMNETAFFYPALETDGKGNVNVKFTLPESVTTWKFLALAHDRDMNSGNVEGKTVASKKVMIQPNMPRFLRQGDKAQVKATISNTSEKMQTGKAVMYLIDPQTEKTVAKCIKNFSVKTGEMSTVDFDVDAADGKINRYPVLICRVTADGRNFSDGEQHYLPILQNKEMVLNTVAFSLNGKDRKTVDLSAMGGKGASMKIEYTANPKMLLVASLPTVATDISENAISQVSAFYANSLSRYLLIENPKLKKLINQWTANDKKSPLLKNDDVKNILLSETPWVVNAENETEQRQLLVNFFDENQTEYRLQRNLQQLGNLQNSDGSFSWWKNMPGNYYITMQVAETLVRLNKMTGEQAQTRRILDKAIGYIVGQMVREVEDMKKRESMEVKNLLPDETSLNVLYTIALDNSRLTERQKNARDYMILKIEKQMAAFSIYGKARIATILALNGRKLKANEYLQSLEEYSVSTPELGRYFDTRKAAYSWFDYKIPTQVAAIEAFKLLKPNDKNMISDMQRWLLQSKRTQNWDTPVNCVNAVYAFADSNTWTSDDKSFSIMAEGKKIKSADNGETIAETYIIPVGIKKLTVSKDDTGISWGAVYSSELKNAVDVNATATGISVKREIIGGTDRKIGDRVKVKFTITADRDYDFVQLQDKRAACLEPVAQLSGYKYGYYAAPKDNVTNYFFNTLSKGKHVIETEYYIDRDGEYASGVCTVQCAYAPEYSGKDAVMRINVK